MGYGRLSEINVYIFQQLIYNADTMLQIFIAHSGKIHLGLVKQVSHTLVQMFRIVLRHNQRVLNGYRK